MSDIFDTITYKEKPKDIFDNLAESWGVSDTLRSVGAVLGGFAAIPVAGLVGIEEGIRTRDIGKTEKAMNYVGSLPQKLLNTERQEQATENVGKILAWPFQKAGAGYAGLTELASTGSLEKSVDVIKGDPGSNIFVPTARVLGEAAAMGAMSGLGKKGKGKPKVEELVREEPKRALVDDIFDTIAKEKPEIVKPAEVPVEPAKPTSTIVPDVLSKEGVGKEPAIVEKVLPEATNESRLAIRAEADAIEAKLTEDFGNLAEYKTMNMKDQASKASAILEGDYEAAKRMAMGKEYPPEGVREATVYEAVKIRAIKEGDVETLHKLATESTVPTRLSEYGQAIKAADSRLMDDPVKVMREVAEVRAEKVKRMTGKETDVTQQTAEIERLSRELETTRKALDERIASVIVKQPKGTYGATNKIINQTRYEQAKLEINQYFKSTTLHAGVDPTILGKIGEVGIYHFEAGLRSFGPWSSRMVKDVGEWVEPHLKDIWEQAKQVTGKSTAEERALKAYKTRKIKETAQLTEKLNALDFSKKEKRITILDPEAKRLKAAHDLAKENYKNAANKSGIVTKEEAAKIVELSKATEDARMAMEQGGDRLQYGAARVAYEHYIEHMKGINNPIKERFRDWTKEVGTVWEENKAKAVLKASKDSARVVADNSVAMVGSLDDSFIGRQGWYTLATHPSVWLPAARKSFMDFARTIGGKNTIDALMADVYSRDRYISGEYQKAGLLNKFEETYPTSLPGRIPIFGRMFKASEAAFEGSGIRIRLGVYDLLADMQKKNGINTMRNNQAEGIGTLVNSLTYRGKWGKKGVSPWVRLVMWAPNIMKGQWDILTAHTLGAGLPTAFARKQAMLNWVKIVSEGVAIATIANAIKPGSAEINPISSAFGTINIGNGQHIDYTAGMRSQIVLFARFFTNRSKDVNTGKITKLEPGFGKNTRWTLGINYLGNKFNPPAAVIRDKLKGEFFGGEKFTWMGAWYRAQTPISVQQGIQVAEKPSIQSAVGVASDVVGVGSVPFKKRKKQHKGGQQ